LDTLGYAWPFLILPLMWVLIGITCGFLTTKICCCPRYLRGTVVAACTFGNSTGLPIVIVTAITQTMALSASDTAEIQLQHCLLLLSIYQIMYPCLQWGLGAQLLKNFKTRCESEPQSLLSLADMSSDQQVGTPSTMPAQPRCEKLKAFVEAVFVPPVIAVLAGVLISLFPFVRGLFVDLYDDDGDALFEFLLNAIAVFGAGAVPLNMLILGAQLASIPGFSTIHWPSTIGAVFAKLIAIPGMVCGVMYLACNLFPSAMGSQKSYIVFVASVVTATPSANNLMVMAELGGGEACGRALASIIFLMYCVAPFTLTFWITVFVSLGK